VSSTIHTPHGDLNSSHEQIVSNASPLRSVGKITLGGRTRRRAVIARALAGRL
jgi:hypothetical protein